MKAYYLSGQGWMICLAKNKVEAKREGVTEWGRGGVRVVRDATRDECADYFRQRRELIIAEG